MTATRADAVQMAWSRPDRFPVLGEKEVHVWSVDLDETATASPGGERWLAEDERRRAAAFYFAAHRRRFITARAVLRELLGRYLEVGPSELRFAVDAYGKPRLASPRGAARIHFNVAHSQGMALYAVTRDRAVGVDVEQVQAEFPYQDIAAQFFSSGERAAIAAQPPSLRPARFFAYWTCKEACLKAVGTGLSGPLASVHVDSAFETGQALVRVAGEQGESMEWFLMPLTPACGYTGAIAVRGKNVRVACRRLVPGRRMSGLGL